MLEELKSKALAAKQMSAYGASEALANAASPSTILALIEVVEAAQSAMGHIDAPIPRRRLGITDPQPEWLTVLRKALEGVSK